MAAREALGRQFFHGTSADLAEGEEIRPAFGYRSANRVYVTDSEEAAHHWARHQTAWSPSRGLEYPPGEEELHVYEVAPKRGSRPKYDPAGTYMQNKHFGLPGEASSFKSSMRIVRKVK